MKVLAISTSTPRGSAALVRDGGEALAVAYVDLQGHSSRLFEAIDAVLAQAGEPRSAIDAIACDVGPGSFTGVRVGVASAKGIALGLGIPLVGVVSLEAMAAAAFASGAAHAGDVVLAAIDAKKNEVFVAAYDADGRAVVAPCTRPLAPEAFAIAGGAAVIVGAIAADVALAPGARLVRGDALDLPDAGWIGKLGAARVGAARSLADVEPLYVRPPDATPARREPGSG